MIDEFIVIVAGTRTFDNYPLLRDKLDVLLANKVKSGSKIVIMSGGATGADRLGEWYAKDRGFECRIVRANWDGHGKRAGPMRNEQMCLMANAAVAFWDNTSPGTRDLIERAKKKGLMVRVETYKKEGEHGESVYRRDATADVPGAGREEGASGTKT